MYMTFVYVLLRYGMAGIKHTCINAMYFSFKKRHVI